MSGSYEDTHLLITSRHVTNYAKIDAYTIFRCLFQIGKY